MVTLDGRVLGEEEREVRVMVNVKDEELIVFDEWSCEREELTGGRRWRDGFSYSPPG